MKLYFIFALLFSTLCSANTDCNDVGKYGEVSKTELKQLIDSNSVTIIDVNSEKTFKENHIPTAVNFYENKTAFEKVLPSSKDSLIVAYCGGPKCTAWQKAAKEACAKGYTNIKHFKGGIKGWKDSG